MKITLQELRTMIRESIKETLKEQVGLNTRAASQGAMTERPPVPGQTTAPTPAPTPAPTGRQRSPQTAQINQTISNVIANLLNLTPAGSRRASLPPTIIIPAVRTAITSLESLTTDMLMLNKKDKLDQANAFLKRVTRIRPEQITDVTQMQQQLIRPISNALFILRRLNQDLGSTDTRFDQMIAQLAATSTAPTSPEVGGMRQGTAPQALAGSQVVPVGYRPEGAPPQERPVMASAMQERRTRKR
jgi:hypothetical protein